MAGTNSNDAGPLVRFFVTHSILLYMAALIVMSFPLGLAWGFDIVVSDELRYVIVGGCFAIIVATYLAERRVEDVGSLAEPGEGVESIETTVQIAILLTIIGLAIGVYMLLKGQYGRGAIFLGGAFLFLQYAIRSGSVETED